MTCQAIPPSIHAAFTPHFPFNVWINGVTSRSLPTEATPLRNSGSAVRELGDDILKKIAIEITEKLRASTTVDWQVRESVRARLRILVRRTLQRWKYPPDQQPEAVESVLQQAEQLASEWSS